MSKLMVAFAMAAGFAASETSAQPAAKKPAAATTYTYSVSRGEFYKKLEDEAAAKNAAAAQNNSSKFTTRAAEAERPVVPDPGAVNVGINSWDQINQPGSMLDYFRYWSPNMAANETEASSPDFNNEIRNSTTAPGHVGLGQETDFRWQPSTYVGKETKLAACALTDQPDKNMYWLHPYTLQPLGNDPVNNPFYRYALPSEFTISSQFYGVKGFTVQGNVEGNAPGSPKDAYAIGVMYMTDRRCSDGNNEYGLWRELASQKPDAKPEEQPLYFYYSTRTNCFPGWGCFADPQGTKEDPQKTSAVTTMTNLRNLDADKPPNFYYSAYMIPDNNPDPDHKTGYKFRVQVVDGYHTDKLATCNINGGPDQPCAFDAPIENWFPAAEMQRGQNYMVTGTQTSISGTTAEGVTIDRAPRFDTKDPKFNVKGTWLGR
ncbi:MAG: hypothetical protein EPN97_13250 [Alphaproteobacteria bacterium]|nr:MAG: hypothetical protein EPN97_13250 [Alphaproteobacteria bacterium]